MPTELIQLRHELSLLNAVQQSLLVADFLPIHDSTDLARVRASVIDMIQVVELGLGLGWGQG